MSSQETLFDAQLGARIRQAREYRKITQAELASALDTTQQRIYQWETGRSGMFVRDLARIISALGTPPGELLPGDQGFDLRDCLRSRYSLLAGIAPDVIDVMFRHMQWLERHYMILHRVPYTPIYYTGPRQDVVVFSEVWVNPCLLGHDRYLYVATQDSLVGYFFMTPIKPGINPYSSDEPKITITRKWNQETKLLEYLGEHGYCWCFLWGWGAWQHHDEYCSPQHKEQMPDPESARKVLADDESQLRHAQAEIIRAVGIQSSFDAEEDLAGD